MLNASKYDTMLLTAVQDAMTLTLTYLYVSRPPDYMLIYNLIICPVKKKSSFSVKWIKYYY